MNHFEATVLLKGAKSADDWQEALVDRDAEDPGDVWYDEWECPRCQTGILMDWPEEAFKELAKLAERAKGE